MRDSCVFYRSFYEGISDLPESNQLEVFHAIFQYSLNFQEPKLAGLSATVFRLIKPQLDANIKKYKNGLKGADHGQKGGRPKEEKPQRNPKETPKEPQENPKLTPNVNDNVNDNENDNENERGLAHFVAEIAESLDENFLRYLKVTSQLQREIELKPEFASKQNAYFTLVQAIPLFKQKVKYLNNQNHNAILRGIKEWLKYNTVSKTDVRWNSYADMAQHCINYLIRKENEAS